MIQQLILLGQQQNKDTAYKYAIALSNTTNNDDTRKTAYNGLYYCRDIDSVKDFQCAKSTSGMTLLTNGFSGRTFTCYHLSRRAAEWTTLYNRNGTSSSNFTGKGMSDAYDTASRDPCYYFSTVQRDNICRKYRPFVGYVNYKSGVPTSGLYTDEWDTLVKTLNIQEGSKLVNKTTDGHLKLTAGLPLCNVEDDGDMTITLKIVDKNRLTVNNSNGNITHPATDATTQSDHVLWIKNGSFGTTDPWNLTEDDGGILCSKVTVNGKKAETVTNAGACGIKIPSKTECTLKFTPVKGKHIFVKWSKTDTNMKLGGGVLFVDNIVQEVVN